MRRFLAALFVFCCTAAPAVAQNAITLPIAANAIADIGNGPIKVRMVAGNASIFTSQSSGVGSTSGSSTTLMLTATPATPPFVGGLISGSGITSGTTVAAYNGTTGVTLSAAMTVPGGTTVSWGSACPSTPPSNVIQASPMAGYYIMYTQARVCAVSPGGPVNTLLVEPIFYDQTAPGGSGSIFHPIYVFTLAGQSNDVGNSNSIPAASPIVPAGQCLQVNPGGSPQIKDANDPIGVLTNGVSTGSAWPAFCIRFLAAHPGALVAFVPTAIDGTSQQAAADQGNGNWDLASASPPGTLVAQSITLTQNAISILISAGYFPIYGGYQWMQGERDGTCIFIGLNPGMGCPGTATQAGYATALAAMVVRLRAAFGPNMPFWMYRLGPTSVTPDAGQNAAYAQVRSAQDTYCNGPVRTDVNCFMATFGAADYGGLGYMLSADIHYNQTGQNVMGELGASAVSSALARSNNFLPGLGRDLYYAYGSVTIGYPVSSGAPFSVNTLNVQGLPPTLVAPLPAPAIAGDSQFSTGIEAINYGGPPNITQRAALGTLLAPTSLTSGVIMGGLNVRGYDGSGAWSSIATGSHLFDTTESWVDATHHGTRQRFRVTPNGTAVLTDSIIMENDTGNYCAAAPGGDMGADTFNCGTVYSGGNRVATAPLTVIGSLPTCNSASDGLFYEVTNGVASPAYNAAVSATGATHDLVWCNGSGWTYH